MKYSFCQKDIPVSVSVNYTFFAQNVWRDVANRATTVSVSEVSVWLSVACIPGIWQKLSSNPEPFIEGILNELN